MLLNSQQIEFSPKDVICDVNESNYDWLYILIKGKASVWINNKLTGFLEAPSYFGELSVFFDQPRSSTIMADTPVSCLVIPGVQIKSLLHRNVSFRYGFAFMLKNKQRIFNDYNIFLASLIDNKRKGAFSLKEIIPLYMNLKPILHQGCNKSAIDFPALDYVIRKLKFRLTSVNTIFLTEDIPPIYNELRKKILSSQETKYKRSYEVLPGKVFILLRDDVSDFIDVTTKLSLYLIEAEKIYKRITGSDAAVAALSKYYFGKKKNSAEIKKLLPFDLAEKRALQKIFGRNLYEQLYEIISQQGDITVQVTSAPVRYYPIAPEMWVNKIRELLFKNFHRDILNTSIKVHIISSNVHSVRNCLSPWLHDNKQEILQWGLDNLKEVDKVTDQENLLYAITSSYFQKNPQKISVRDAYDEQYGVYHFDDPFLTRINVTLIDTKKIRGKVDLYLNEISDENNLIVNINYAYGRQAKSIMQNLMLLFNKQIYSISIFGKAGGIVGQRGDIVLPDNILIQENDGLYPTFHSDVLKKDFLELGWKKNIHHGGLLTVQGTLTQSRNLLKYYQLFWNIIAMEMESGHYIQEISSAKNYGLLNENIITRFIYYLSDLPLSAHENLTVRMKMEEGLSTVYTITRCVLNKIFK